MSISAESLAEDDGDIRPVVARTGSRDFGMWVFLGILLLGGVVLFSALSARRESLTAPRTSAPVDDPASRISSPPPLALPAAFEDPNAPRSLQPIRKLEPVPVFQPAVTTPARVQIVQQPAPVVTAQVGTGAPFEDRNPQPAIVYDTARSAPPAALDTAARDARGSQRVTAGRFANPARTVPQGTVIPAVLETALDSTRPGAARALVQRDVYGFDGTRVLIQRGSRLYGEYGADLAQGQNRALVRWTRLIRPDGVTIDLDSPASDPLGRAGIKGKVDSKFLQRFGGAILQSVLDIGVGVAARKASGGVILALPGSAQTLQVQQPQQIQPTLKVEHGTSVSVFVARDLDFSTVEY